MDGGRGDISLDAGSLSKHDEVVGFDRTVDDAGDIDDVRADVSDKHAALCNVESSGEVEVAVDDSEECQVGVTLDGAVDSRLFSYHSIGGHRPCLLRAREGVGSNGLECVMLR